MSDTVTVEGTVTRIKFAGEESFLIGEINCSTTFKGNMPGVKLGSKIIIKGREKEHEKFGPQILVSTYDFVNPTEAEKKLIESRKFVENLDIGHVTTSKILALYKDSAQKILEANPYQVIADISGIGFKTADKIAQKIGIDGDHPKRIQECILHVLDKASESGHVYLPYGELVQKTYEFTECDYDVIEGLVQKLFDPWEDFFGRPQKPRLKNIEGLVYLTKLYDAENAVAAHIDRLRSLPPMFWGKKKTPESLLEQFSEAQNDIELSDEQKEAVKAALTDRLLVITGGPGVGKTTIVKAIAQILRWGNRKLALCAPTGRAARRLKESSGLDDGQTIHRLLEYKPRSDIFSRNSEYPLDADVVICDETSMLDIELAYALLDAIGDRTSIIFIGDVDQLPPVGPGRVFRDLIECQKVKVLRLTKIFRQKESSLIITGSRKILAREIPDFGSNTEKHDFFRFTYTSNEEAIETLIDLVLRKIPQKFGIPSDEIQILSPNKKETTFLSTSYLNKVFQKEMRGMNSTSKQVPYLVGDRIIQLKNNYTHFVMNGDIGVVESVYANGADILWFGAENTRCRYSSQDLWDTDLAYAITIHKAQGSEYPAVIVIGDILTMRPGFYNRNMLYTAVTRGKKLTVLFESARKKNLAKILSFNEEERYSKLLEKLVEPMESGPVEDGPFGNGTIDFSKYRG